ncbi:MAG: response regulator, partial [Chitinispirillaceae bacterium]|nr:response regulator [Chitinispirillaceae bacterium]
MSISIVKDSNTIRSILIISTDTQFKIEVKNALENTAYKIIEASSQTEALSLLEKINISVMFLDIERTPAIELDIVSYVRTRYDAEVVIITSVREIEEATYALRNGAAFYLVKPVKGTDILILLEKLYDKISQKKENLELEQRFLNDLMAGS